MPDDKTPDDSHAHSGDSATAGDSTAGDGTVAVPEVAAETIAVGADHAGVHLKDAIVMHLKGRGYDVVDLGTHGEARVDYPDFGAAVGRAVASGQADLGVAVCGSGIGICMAADKVPGVRAGTVHDVTSARLAREHNNANVICLGERLTGRAVALDSVDAFLAASFQQGRHTARVAKIDALQKEI